MITEYIIIKNKKELDYLKNINLKNKKIIFLYPNCFDNRLKNITTNVRDILNQEDHYQILKKVIFVKKKFINELSKNNNLNDANKANLRHFFLKTISSLFYLLKLLNKIQKLYIYKSHKWQKVKSEKKTINELLKDIYFNKRLIDLGVPNVRRENFLEEKLNKIILFLIKKKKIVMCSNYNYNFKKISIDLYKKKKIICISLDSKKNFLINFLNNMVKIFNPLKKDIFLNFRPYIVKTYKLENEIKSLISKLNNKEINYYNFGINKILANAVNYQNEIIPFTKNLFNILNVQLYISNHTRGIISPVIAMVSKENKIKSILIPHGTLSHNKNKFINELMKEVAMGFVDDNFSSQIICQSKITENFLNSNFPKKIYKKFNPIMW